MTRLSKDGRELKEMDEEEEYRHLMSMESDREDLV